jgi:hypothetical protein
MAICDTVTKNGNSIEKLSPDGVVDIANCNSVTFIPNRMTCIEQRSTGKLNTRFANSGKKTWLTNISVKYSNSSQSARAYVKGVVLDGNCYKDGLDFFYYGIPAGVAKKLFSDAFKGLKMKVQSIVKYVEKSNDGYGWVSGKTDKLVDVLLVSDGRKFKSLSISQMLDEFKTKGLSPECYMVFKPRVICTCEESIGEAGVLVQPWAIWGTPETLFVYGDSKARSLSAGMAQEAKSTAKLPKDLKASDFVKALLADPSLDPFESTLPPVLPEKF